MKTQFHPSYGYLTEDEAKQLFKLPFNADDEKRKIMRRASARKAAKTRADKAAARK